MRFYAFLIDEVDGRCPRPVSANWRTTADLASVGAKRAARAVNPRKIGRAAADPAAGPSWAAFYVINSYIFVSPSLTRMSLILKSYKQGGLRL